MNAWLAPPRLGSSVVRWASHTQCQSRYRDGLKKAFQPTLTWRMADAAFSLHTGVLIEQRPVFVIFPHRSQFMLSFIRQHWAFEQTARYNNAAHMAPHPRLVAVRAGDHSKNHVFGICSRKIAAHFRRDMGFSRLRRRADSGLAKPDR